MPTATHDTTTPPLDSLSGIADAEKREEQRIEEVAIRNQEEIGEMKRALEEERRVKEAMARESNEREVEEHEKTTTKEMLDHGEEERSAAKKALETVYQKKRQAVIGGLVEHVLSGAFLS